MATPYKVKRIFLYQKCGTEKWLRSIAHHRNVHDGIWQFGWPTWLHTVSLPNYGFESHTYLTHMAKHYEDAANVTVFLEGDMDTHGGGALFSSDVSFSLPFTWLVTDTIGVESIESDDENEYKPAVSDNLPDVLKRVDLEIKRQQSKRGSPPPLCSAIYDIEALLREFWPEFDVKSKRCFHQQVGGQFAVRREAIWMHPRSLFEKAVEVMTPGAYGGLEAYLLRVNAAGGVCAGLTDGCAKEGKDKEADKEADKDADKDADNAANGNAPTADADEKKELPAPAILAHRGKQLALGLPTVDRALGWSRTKSNLTHCEASYYTAVLLANAWQFLFTRDGCVGREWQTAMPLRAQCARLRKRAGGVCKRGSAFHTQCSCELSDDKEREAFEKEFDKLNEALEKENEKRDEALDDEKARPWGFGMLDLEMDAWRGVG